MKQKKVKNYGLVILFFSLLFGLSIVSFLAPVRSFSDLENRSLGLQPKFSIETYLEKDYQQELNQAKNDQFFGRDTWMKWKTNFQKLLGLHTFQDVYVGKDNLLMEEVFHPTEESLEKKKNAVTQFVKKYPELSYSFLLAPNKIALYPDKIIRKQTIEQNFLITSFLRALPEEVHRIDIYHALLEHKEEQIYFKTDHHWTSLGAKYAYETLRESLYPEEVYSYVPLYLKSQFYGSLAKKANFFEEGDILEAYYNPKVLQLVHYVEEKRQSTSLFQKKNLKSADPYTVFLDGNHARIDLETTTKNERHLLLLKDSYANSMLPFLVSHYQTITVIDPRYYYGSLENILEEREINEVLFLYSANNFFQDHAFEDLLT